MVVEVRDRYCPVLQEVNELGRLIVGDVVAHFPTWLEQCRTSFHRFQECLHKHISYEAQTGFHRTMRETAPEKGPQVTELAGEHIRLLGESEAIAEELASCGTADQARVRDIVRHIENVVAHFRYHAANELELAHQILGTTTDPKVRRLLQRPCSFGARPADEA